ncbi:hypothetical protein [Natrinema sp. 74]|uniref:hypothetical protein n=1 Tax=Natrinema sp. 74 TaxID=3384159 RepID=UPI0038D35F72
MFLLSVVGVIGALLFLGLSVYPFQYGVVESIVLAGGFVVLSIFQFVLDDTDI